MPRSPQESSYLRVSYHRRASEHPEMPRLFTEGDSWFDFPKHANTIDLLEAPDDLVLLRLECSGDEIVEILSGRQKEKLRDYLEDAVRKGVGPHALLFSGGGYDIIGTSFHQLIRREPEADNAEGWMFEDRVGRKIEQIEAAFHELADLRDNHSPQTKIITHGYDYAIPSPEGARYLGHSFGPWMYPTLVDHGVPERLWQPISKRLIDLFNNMLSNIEAEVPGFVHVDARGVVGEQGWSDELNPKRQGFERVARKIRAAINHAMTDAGRQCSNT